MTKFSFNPAVHLSIAWGVTLAVLTLVEWNSLDNDPMRQQILMPFIQRDVIMAAGDTIIEGELYSNADERSTSAAAVSVPHRVKFRFDGPLFLACFFLPVLVFHGLGWLVSRGK